MTLVTFNQSLRIKRAELAERTHIRPGMPGMSLMPVMLPLGMLCSPYVQGCSLKVIKVTFLIQAKYTLQASQVLSPS